ncbi:MAG: MBL fold metallo-hydrolase [Pseudolabrys sp.]|nr:MBL fold metallo-hydrolase [Pseudolabrys sp.]
MAGFNRRSFLAAAPFIFTATALARAAAPAAKTQTPGTYRFRLGDYQLTALYDGIWRLPIEDNFIRNAGKADVNAALAAGFLPPDVLPVSFTALLVNTGRKLVLIDTGTAGQITDSAGTLTANLATAGIKPAQIDTILISHFHPDHINGLKTKDGGKVFANAEIMVPQVEWDFWMDESRIETAEGVVKKYFLNARRIFRDLAREVHRFQPGREIAPGISAIAAPGHTPGHVAFTVSSGNQTMLVIGDAARNPELFVRHPAWQPSFDMDGPLAVATRQSLLQKAAADKLLVHGYHFPFPATGHIAARAEGYELVPVLWQPL